MYGQQQIYGGYPAMMGGAYAYPAQAPQAPVLKQLLTADEVAKLQKNPVHFSTKLTEDEYLRACCTHKTATVPGQMSQITLEKLPNGKHRCSICGAEFNLIDLNTPMQEIEVICNSAWDLLQSIKTYYGNSPEAMRDFYLMIGFLPKLKYLWNVAKQYFDKVTGNFGMLGNGNDNSGFATLANILGGGAMAGGIVPGMNPAMNYYNYGYPAAGAPFNPAMGQTPAMAMPQMPTAPGPMPAAPAPQPTYGNVVYAAPPAAPVAAPGQVPMYGYGQQPQAAPAVPMGTNPIGYVEQQQPDFTAGMAAANAGTTQAAPATPPMPEPPKNPNLQDNKAAVSKKFAG